MFIDIGKIKIHISVPAAALIAFAANNMSGQIYIFAFLSMLAHETVHIICLFYCGCKNVLVKIYPGGIKLSADGFGGLSYKKTFFCSLSAPCANILLGAALLFFCLKNEDILLRTFALTNISVGIVNFIPLPFLDGGRVFSAFVRQRMDIVKADKIISVVAIFSIVFLFAILFFLLLRKEYFFFFLFFAIYCFCELIYDKKYMKLGNVM